MKEKNKEFSAVKRRVLQYLEYKHITRSACYQKTGISDGVLSQNNGMSEDNIMRFISVYTDLSPDWLLTGKGSMIRNGNLVAEQFSYFSTNDQTNSAAVTNLKDRIIELQAELIKFHEQNDMLKNRITELKEQIANFKLAE